VLSAARKLGDDSVYDIVYDIVYDNPGCCQLVNDPTILVHRLQVFRRISSNMARRRNRIHVSEQCAV
jgi:hypothetical protein